jgi:hypothetical protein
MKITFLLAFFSLFIVGCNMNPSKEARIQLLETNMEQTLETIDELEDKVQTLEGLNKELEARLLDLEKASS